MLLKILKNQISNQSADWQEVFALLESFGIRENYLSNHMKQELKNAFHQ